jgi:benzoylformate decarboxylase
VAFIIVNNRSYQALVELGRHFKLAELPGTQLPQLDYCGLAQAQGVAALRVERACELDAALAHAFTVAHPVLVEVCVVP